MKQLQFDLKEYERHQVEGNIYLLGSPEYEYKVEKNINRIVNSNKDRDIPGPVSYEIFRDVKFWDIPANVHLKHIRSIPHTLKADYIDVNLATKNEIEKNLLNKCGTYLVACYRLWREENWPNVIYAKEHKIYIQSCWWDGGFITGKVAIFRNGYKNIAHTHRVKIDKKLNLTYPNIKFNYPNRPEGNFMQFDEFNQVMQDNLKIVFDLMVKLDKNPPKVK